MAGGEDRLIAWLAGFAGAGDRIGDDAVLLTLGERQYAFSVDTQRAGVHIPVDLDPAAAARRLLAVSLSDLAATGAEPRWMLVALGIDDEDAARRFLAALVRAGRRYEVELIGGDTARPTTPGRLDASLTVVGEIPADGASLTRDAARPDDRLWIGGPVGESALGLDLVRLGARIAKRRANLPEGLPDGLAVSPAGSFAATWNRGRRSNWACCWASGRRPGPPSTSRTAWPRTRRVSAGGAGSAANSRKARSPFGQTPAAWPATCAAIRSSWFWAGARTTCFCSPCRPTPAYAIPGAGRSAASRPGPA